MEMQFAVSCALPLKFKFHYSTQTKQVHGTGTEFFEISLAFFSLDENDLLLINRSKVAFYCIMN